MLILISLPEHLVSLSVYVGVQVFCVYLLYLLCVLFVLFCVCSIVGCESGSSICVRIFISFVERSFHSRKSFLGWVQLCVRLIWFQEFMLLELRTNYRRCYRFWNWPDFILIYIHFVPMSCLHLYWSSYSILCGAGICLPVFHDNIDHTCHSRESWSPLDKYI